MSDYQEALIEFLAEPENLPTALEVSDQIEKVKDKLQCAFWAALRTDLEARLAASGLNLGWALLPTKLRPVEDYYGCSIRQIGRPHTSERFLRIHMEQSNRGTGNRLYYGICWNRETVGDLGISEIQHMKANPALAGFRASPPWWISARNLDYYLRRNEFLIAMSERKSDLVFSVAQPFWTFFEELRDSVMQIDAVLAR